MLDRSWTGSQGIAQRFRLQWADLSVWRDAAAGAALSSGHGAAALADLWGAREIILLGYDMQRTEGRNHWHADHKTSENCTLVATWPKLFERISGLFHAKVINATRQTAVTCFPRVRLEDALCRS